MRHQPNIYSQLLQPLQWSIFKPIVVRHDGDAYAKSFGSWSHLLTMIYAQLSGANSLRAVEAGFNAHARMHGRLGAVPVHRSTLADANSRRPVAVFADVLAILAHSHGRKKRVQGRAILRILDASPIPLGQLFSCAAWNGRIKGFKLHLAFDPECDHPQVLAITKATVNDITPARSMPLERGVLYVFDKGYCSFEWWTNIAQNGAFFITRPKANMGWKTLKTRPLKQTTGDGFSVLKDCEVELASKGDSKLSMRLRLITVKPDDAKAFTLITNDMRHSAITIAVRYKQRWQIELLFRWLKQHLKLRNFLGRSENAIRLQIIAAMIAYVLIKLAADRHHVSLLALRFAELIAACLFETRSIAQIIIPVTKKPKRKSPRIVQSTKPVAMT